MNSQSGVQTGCMGQWRKFALGGPKDLGHFGPEWRADLQGVLKLKLENALVNNLSHQPCF